MAGRFDDLIPAGNGMDMGGGTVTPQQMQAFATGKPRGRFDDLIPVKRAGGANSRPGMGAAEDAARSAVGGAQNAATTMLGIPGDLQALARHVTGQDQPSVGGLVANSMGQGNAPLYAQTGHMSPEQAAAWGIDPDVMLPSSAALNAKRQQFTGPDHVPQTTVGRYAQSVGSFLPNMIAGPESLPLKLLGAGASGIASQAAGDATHGTALEPWARAGAAIAAGHVAGLPFGPSGGTK